MRVLHLSSYDNLGGAARAANRLHQALRSIDVDSQMLVRKSSGNDTYVHSPHGLIDWTVAKGQRYVDRAIARIGGSRRQQRFSPALSPDTVVRHLQQIDPHILHLHWINDGFLNLSSIGKITVPMVWTLHDMWPFSGGCHYSGDCFRFTTSCGSCPLLSSHKENDLSRVVWNRKRHNYDKQNLTILAPSQWMGELAKKSSLLREKRIEIIPYGLDLDKFSPANQEWARLKLGLPTSKHLVLSGSVDFQNDHRKGFDRFGKLCKTLYEIEPDKFCFAFFGGSKQTEHEIDGIRMLGLGTLSSQAQLTAAYSAADIFISVSREDNLPNTIMESLACGTPVAAYNVGGVNDMVVDGETGILAAPDDPTTLARKISNLLNDPGRLFSIRSNARAKTVRDYSLAKIARKHLDLYASITSQSRV